MEAPAADFDPACPFCRNLAGNPRCAFVGKSDGVSSFINPRQYRPGAMLVVPNRHVATVFDMTPKEWSAVAVHARQVAVAACAAFDAPGVNIFQNNGPSAGQTVFHVHIHVVPRPADDEGPAIFGEAHFEKAPVAARFATAARIRERLPAPMRG